MAPGVTITKQDFSRVINYNSKTISFFSGHFEKGEYDKPTLVQTAVQFKNLFGRALAENYNDWYQAYNFLQYSSNLYITRAPSDAMNAYGASPFEDIPTLILNKEDFDNKFTNIPLLPENYIKFIAQTPGTWGNLLRISMINAVNWENNVEVFDGIFAKDLISYMEEGEYTFFVIRNSQVVETFTKKFNEVHDINDESVYIYVKSILPDYNIIDGNFTLFDGKNDFTKIYDGNYPYDYHTIGSFYGDYNISMIGGYQVQPNESEILEGYETVLSKEDYELDLILGNDRNNQGAINLAETRKDCIAFIGYNGDFKETLDYRDTIGSYGYVSFISNYKKQYDQFTSKYRWVSLVGDICGLKSQSDYTRQEWFSSAGITRPILNVIALKLSLNKDKQDILYQNSINSIIRQNNTFYMTGQKLLLSKVSSVNRVNVRSLLNRLEKDTQKLARYGLFKENDDFTRNNLRIEIKRYLEDIKSARGVYNYNVICDETNQKTPEELVIDVIIQPTMVTEYIRLRMLNVGTNTISEVQSRSL